MDRNVTAYIEPNDYVSAIIAPFFGEKQQESFHGIVYFRIFFDKLVGAIRRRVEDNGAAIGTRDENYERLVKMMRDIRDVSNEEDEDVRSQPVARFLIAAADVPDEQKPAAQVFFAQAWMDIHNMTIGEDFAKLVTEADKAKAVLFPLYCAKIYMRLHLEGLRTWSADSPHLESFVAVQNAWLSLNTGVDSETVDPKATVPETLRDKVAVFVTRTGDEETERVLMNPSSWKTSILGTGGDGDLWYPKPSLKKIERVLWSFLVGSVTDYLDFVHDPDDEPDTVLHSFKILRTGFGFPDRVTEDNVDYLISVAAKLKKISTGMSNTVSEHTEEGADYLLSLEQYLDRYVDILKKWKDVKPDRCRKPVCDQIRAKISDAVRRLDGAISDLLYVFLMDRNHGWGKYFRASIVPDIVRRQMVKNYAIFNFLFKVRGTDEEAATQRRAVVEHMNLLDNPGLDLDEVSGARNVAMYVRHLLSAFRYDTLYGLMRLPTVGMYGRALDYVIDSFFKEGGHYLDDRNLIELTKQQKQLIKDKRAEIRQRFADPTKRRLAIVYFNKELEIRKEVVPDEVEEEEWTDDEEEEEDEESSLVEQWRKQDKLRDAKSKKRRKKKEKDLEGFVVEEEEDEGEGEVEAERKAPSGRRRRRVEEPPTPVVQYKYGEIGKYDDDEVAAAEKNPMLPSDKWEPHKVWVFEDTLPYYHTNGFPSEEEYQDKLYLPMVPKEGARLYDVRVRVWFTDEADWASRFMVLSQIGRSTLQVKVLSPFHTDPWVKAAFSPMYIDVWQDLMEEDRNADETPVEEDELEEELEDEPDANPKETLQEEGAQVQAAIGQRLISLGEMQLDFAPFTQTMQETLWRITEVYQLSELSQLPMHPDWLYQDEQVDVMTSLSTSAPVMLSVSEVEHDNVREFAVQRIGENTEKKDPVLFVVVGRETYYNRDVYGPWDENVPRLVEMVSTSLMVYHRLFGIPVKSMGLLFRETLALHEQVVGIRPTGSEDLDLGVLANNVVAGNPLAAVSNATWQDVLLAADYARFLVALAMHGGREQEAGTSFGAFFQRNRRRLRYWPSATDTPSVAFTRSLTILKSVGLPTRREAIRSKVDVLSLTRKLAEAEGGVWQSKLDEAEETLSLRIRISAELARESSGRVEETVREFFCADELVTLMRSTMTSDDIRVASEMFLGWVSERSVLSEVLQFSEETRKYSVAKVPIDSTLYADKLAPTNALVSSSTAGLARSHNVYAFLHIMHYAFGEILFRKRRDGHFVLTDIMPAAAITAAVHDVRASLQQRHIAQDGEDGGGFLTV